VPFDPSFVGKLNAYMSAADDLLRTPEDKPTIGLLLCRSKNRVVVEYALRGMTKPIGVADWETDLVSELPENLKGTLPTVAEIEAELEIRARAPSATRADHHRGACRWWMWKRASR